jgi:nucleoside transporter
VAEPPPLAARTPGSLQLRLALLLFSEYLVWGTWFVSLGSWLGATLHFSGTQIGAMYGSLAIAGLITPLIGGVVADRFAHAERMLAVLHGIGGLVLLVAARQTQFNTLYAAVLVYAFCYLPTLALVPSLALRHLAQPSTEFPVLRAVGTGGWIAGGVLTGALAIELTATPMQLAGWMSLLFAGYCLTLPATPPLHRNAPRSWSALLGLEAIGLVRDPMFALFLLANVALCIPNQFYTAFGALYLTDLHIPRPAMLLTLGQVTEILVLLFLPRLTMKLGARGVLLTGAGAWVIRSLLFSFGSGTNTGVIYAGLLLHGFAYGCAYIAGQVVVNERAPVRIRSAAQGVWAVATVGIGNLLGTWSSGFAVQRYTTPAGARDWSMIWVASAIVSSVTLIAVLLTRRIENVPPINAGAP